MVMDGSRVARRAKAMILLRMVLRRSRSSVRVIVLST
jgi:hypothetical protein